jgi:glycosyltransferase involved in cell wall biosynthesis
VSSLKNGLSFTLKNADYLLAVSNQTRKELIQILNVPRERIYVVTHGVDPKFKKLNKDNFFFNRLRKKFGLQSPYILYVGTIGHHKNIMGILEAYSISYNQGIDTPLVLAGPRGNAWKEANKWVINKGMKKNVKFIGPLDQHKDDITDLYNGASLFVFPSFYEGWTAPPMEAMACGVPVITSNCSSIPETVGNSAIKIDPNDSKNLAFEIKRVLSDKRLQLELINKGLKHVSMHTWERASRKFVEVFNDIQRRGPWMGKRL